MTMATSVTTGLLPLMYQIRGNWGETQ